MIRMLFVAIFLIIFIILSFPALGILWIWGKFDKPSADLANLRFVQWAFKVILFLSGTKLTVIGEENVPKDRSVLYICNHQSYFDTVITYSRCPGLTGYVSKNSLEKVPLLSAWMKRLYCLFLDRDNIKEGMKTILEGINYLKQGISICIFPEGTRNLHPKELMPFKEGSFKLSLKSGCPIVPIALTNSSAIFEDQFPFLKKAPVILQYGKPIFPQELDAETKKHIGAYAQSVIAQMLEENEQYLNTP